MKGENDCWMSWDLEPDLEGRGGVERHLTGLRCEQNCELGLEHEFKRQSAPEQRVYEPANNSRQTAPGGRQQTGPDVQRDAEGVGSELKRETPAF